MRSVLVGAVESTAEALLALVEGGAAPALVCTLPVARANRHSDFVDLRPEAEAAGAPVLEVSNVNDASVLDAIRAVAPDIVFVIGWSQICRPELLAIPALGCIGFHPAPLPENRGRAVIPWTILQGRAETAGTLFWMDEGMDSGDIVVQERFAVAGDETARSLYDKHLHALRRMIAVGLDALRRGSVRRVPQDHSRATWCARRTAADGLINWGAPAREVWTLIRATGRPYPGAFTHHRDAILTIWDASLHGAGPYWGVPGQVQAFMDGGALVQCGDREHVLLHSVQPEGSGSQPASAVLRLHERMGHDVRGSA